MYGYWLKESSIHNLLSLGFTGPGVVFGPRALLRAEVTISTNNKILLAVGSQLTILDRL